jgi:bifunctional non-homologous end joining protein LigD
MRNEGMRGRGNFVNIPTPVPLGRQAKPFDDPNWIFEIKHDGFRALALIEQGHCWLVSRRKHKFTSFGNLAGALGREVKVDMAILDGELAVPDEHGSVFASIMKRRRDVRYYAFDLLWLNGKDLRGLPLVARKQMLKRIIPAGSAHVLYVDHTKGSGTHVYRLACQLDLEGIVAKKADSPYEDNGSDPYWVKIKNPAYSQKERRGDLFKRAG